MDIQKMTEEKSKAVENKKPFLEEEGDIWEKFYNGEAVAIPTNRTLDKFGNNVMGAGLAKDAKELFPTLPGLIGRAIRHNKGKIDVFLYRLPTSKLDEDKKMLHSLLFTFPTKNNWWEESSLEIIERSAIKLTAVIDIIEKDLHVKKVYLPRVGCGLGKRDWEKEVKPLLLEIFDDRFIILTKPNDAYSIE